MDECSSLYFSQMKRYLVILLMSCVVSCKQSTPSTKAVNSHKAVTKNAQVEVVNFEDLSSYLNRKDHTTYIVNFWATWCKPCIKELPYFEAITTSYPKDEVQVILVSLDFREQLETGLLPFIEKYRLQSKVLLLDDPAANDWIPKVNSNWSGAIPATLIYNQKKRQFYEQSFTSDSLDEALKTFL